MGLTDWFPGVRQGTPYADRWRSFLGDLQSQGVTIDPTQSGGYANRNIRGTNTPSLHASDRAYDVNWRANPEGSRQNEADIARQHLERDMGGNVGPITQIHPMIARETAARHGMRWGGDFRTRSPDPMHFEVAGPAPGPIQNRSLIAHAGLTPPRPPTPTGAPTTMATASGPGLSGLLNWIVPQAQAQEPMPPPAMPGFSPQMLAQITQALQPQQPQQAPQTPASFLDRLIPPEMRGQGSFPSMPSFGGADSLLPPEMRGAGRMPNLDTMLSPEMRGPAPPPTAPMGMPQIAPPPQQPQTPSALDIGWQPPPPDVPPFPEGTVTPEAMPPQQPAAAAPQPQEEGPGFFGRLMTNPAFLAGLSILGTAPGGNWGPAGAQAAGQAMQARRQEEEHQRTRRQRSTMDRIWGEAFPNGQPNMQHPLLAGQTPQVAAMIAGMGPEAAMPLLARSAMERRQLEFKEAGGQGFIFDPRTGQVTPVAGTGGGKPPSGFRFVEGSNNQRLEPIPGGPGEQVSAESAGKLAVMRTAQSHFTEARNYFLNQFNAGEAGRHAVGGAVLAPQYNQARRTVQLAVEGALRAVSGAAAPEAEVQRLTDFFTPRAFDPPAVRKQKMDMLQEFMTNHEEIVTRGRGGPQAGADGFSIRRLQ